ncbi:hypothetical protein WR25_23702 [Diploscapter pachys]|uniref:Uncharacterized protein n=1 Tax=Diploscapter pachys TaxID=2018661 RepID=A0A2A2JDR2_9BILA|nr:hypothetical protein WR25_23702 [Diploscapter pachys]
MRDFLPADRLESGVVESTRHCIFAQALRQTQIRECANAAAQNEVRKGARKEERKRGKVNEVMEGGMSNTNSTTTMTTIMPEELPHDDVEMDGFESYTRMLQILLIEDCVRSTLGVIIYTYIIVVNLQKRINSRKAIYSAAILTIIVLEILICGVYLQSYKTENLLILEVFPHYISFVCAAAGKFFVDRQQTRQRMSLSAKKFQKKITSLILIQGIIGFVISIGTILVVVFGRWLSDKTTHFQTYLQIESYILLYFHLIQWSYVVNGIVLYLLSRRILKGADLYMVEQGNNKHMNRVGITVVGNMIED